MRPAPDRYRNPIGRYKVRRSADCRSCGLCVELCPHGVHQKPAGYSLTLRPHDHLCIGPSCAETDHYCIDRCPNHALSLARNPTADAIGDPRWTSDLILSTWHQAETGHAPPAASSSSTAPRAAGSTSYAFASRSSPRSLWTPARSTPASS